MLDDAPVDGGEWGFWQPYTTGRRSVLFAPTRQDVTG